MKRIASRLSEADIAAVVGLAGAAGAAEGSVARVVEPRSHAARVRQPAVSAMRTAHRDGPRRGSRSRSSLRCVLYLRPAADAAAAAQVAGRDAAQRDDAGHHDAASIWRAPATASPATPTPGGTRVRRRPGDADALRQPLRAQHHARRRDRHRPVDRRRVLPNDAHGRLARRHADVSGDALRVVHEGDARGLRRDLRVPDVGAAGEAAEPAARAALSRSTSASCWSAGARSTSRRASTCPIRSRSAQWNRGAYLVEGLGHCSMCHTAINRAWRLERSRRRSKAG